MNCPVGTLSCGFVVVHSYSYIFYGSNHIILAAWMNLGNFEGFRTEHIDQEYIFTTPGVLAPQNRSLGRIINGFTAKPPFSFYYTARIWDKVFKNSEM